MRPPRVSHDFQRTATDSVPDCPLVKSNCLLRGKGAKQGGPEHSIFYLGTAPQNSRFRRSEGLFLSLGWAPVFGRAARFGLRGHGLSLAMMVLAAIRFACPSGHAVAPGLTNRRTPRPSP